MTDHFCPSHERKNMEREFKDLVQISGNNRTYTQRFQELSVMVPHEVDTTERLINKYIDGLPMIVKSTLMGSKPQTIESAIQLAGALTDEYVRYGQLTRSDNLLPEPPKVGEKTNEPP